MNKNGQVASFAVQNESINEYVKTLETRAKVETSENIYTKRNQSAEAKRAHLVSLTTGLLSGMDPISPPRTPSPLLLRPRSIFR